MDGYATKGIVVLNPCQGLAGGVRLGPTFSIINARRANDSTVGSSIRFREAERGNSGQQSSPLKEIHATLLHRTKGAIQVRFSTKLKKPAAVKVMRQSSGNLLIELLNTLGSGIQKSRGQSILPVDEV